MKNIETINKCIHWTIMSVALALTTLSAYAQTDGDISKSKEWPSMPVLEITTVGGVEPTATLVYPPEGCVGQGITSEYVTGKLVMSLNGESIYDSGEYIKGESGVRIKIRGNNSGAFLQQKPYKLKLSKKADLLEMGKAYKSKDWALLSLSTWNTVMTNEESNILPLMGLAVGRVLEQPWTPNIKAVNVMLNGKYKGLYYLIETVERADTRIVTSKTGFVIENDAYWWKPDEVYFRTNRQHPYMGYTFKYPDTDDMTDAEKNAICDYMNTVEEAIFKCDGSAAEFIDYDSFARWILGHDILGTKDAAGSNMFLYKDDLDSNAPESSKLMMGTMWDFDTSFMVGANEWSTVHSHPVFYYEQLFKDPLFVKKYLEKYNNYKDKVYEYVEDYFNNLKNVNGEAIKQSMALHKEIYPSQCKNTLEKQIDESLNFLKSRLKALEEMTKDLETETGIQETSSEQRHLVMRTDIYGNDLTKVENCRLSENIYVEKYSDGTVRKVCHLTTK